MRPCGSLLLLAAAMATGCARTPAATVATGNATECALTIEVDVIAKRVAAVRGLPFRRPLEVHVVDDKTFEARMKEEAEAPPPNDLDRIVEAIRIAFGTTDDDAWGASSKVDFSGFYSPTRKALFVRDDLDAREGVAGMRTSFAHEIAHALQDQHFDLAGVSARLEKLDRDAELAARSVVEGDALVTSYLWNVSGDERRVASAVDVVGRLLAVKAITTFDDVHAKYYAGGAFVAAVHQSGGFAAVDALFRDPPSSGKQVLHPAKYAAGQPPTPVARLPVPDGWESIAGGVFGELRTRALLRQCLPTFVAREAAAGWAGDRYAVVTKDKRVAALWVSTWDDEAAAERFSRRLEAQQPCRRLPSASDRFEVHDVVSIVVRGRDVVFERGLDPGEWNVDAMLATIGARPPHTPRSLPQALIEWKIAYDPAALLSGRKFAGIGITAVVPDEFEASVEEPNASLVIARNGPYPRAGATLRTLRAKGWKEPPDWKALPTMFPAAGEWTLSEPVDDSKTMAGRWWQTRTRSLRRAGATIGAWTVATTVVANKGVVGQMRVVLETFARSAEDEAALAPFLESITLP